MNHSVEIVLELASSLPEQRSLPFAELAAGSANNNSDLNSIAVVTWNRFTLTSAIQKFIGATLIQASDPGNINACKLLATAAILFGIDAAKARIFSGEEEKVVECIERGPRFTHFLNWEKCKKLIPDEQLLKALIVGLKDEGFLKETDGTYYLSAGGFTMFKIGRKVVENPKY